MFKVLGGPGLDSYYFDIGCKYSLRRKKVEDRRPGHPGYILEGTICRYTLEGNEISPNLLLKIPQLPKDMPIEDALYREKSVKWLLNNGYVPQSTDNKSILLVEKNRAEQSLEVQVLLRKFVNMAQIITKFVKHCDTKDRHNPEIAKEEYQEWHQLFESNREAFKDKTDLLIILLEEGRQSLRKSEWQRTEECLMACSSVAPESFGIKGLYGDFLAFKEEKAASAKFMELCWNKSGYESVCYLEKALRADPENADAQKQLKGVVCSQEWNLHLHTTSYLACADKTSEAAASYVRGAKRLNKGIRDPAVSLIAAQKDIEDLAARGRLESSQSWKAGDFISPTAPSTPKSPRLGLGRSSHSIKSTTKDQKGSTLKRRFLPQKTDMQALEGLLWWYEGKEKWLKAEYVARYFLDKIPDGDKKRFDIASCLARVLQKQDREVEASKVYFELAKHEYKNGRPNNAKDCLELLPPDLGAFTAQEKRMIYLMILELNADVKIPLLQKGVEDIHQLPSQNNTGDWAWFEIEHPDFVACAYTATSQFLFRKRTVEVISLETADKAIYAMEFPENTIPDECLLFAKKRIRWLLANGYTPEISSSVCTFSLPSSKSLIKRLEALESEYAIHAKTWLERGSKALAYYYMQLAFRKGPRTEEVQALYAETALLVGRPQLALHLFNNLTPTATNLERALKAATDLSNEAAEEAYRRILTALAKSPTIIPIAALHAYHYFQDKDTLFATRFYNKANGLMLLFAKLACQTDPRQRRELYKAIGATTCYDYYETKRALTESVFTPTTLDRQKHDMAAFVQSAEFVKEQQQIQRYVSKNQDAHLTELLEAIQSEDYYKAEKAFLYAREEHTITTLQNQVRTLHNLWVDFIRPLERADNESISSFFLDSPIQSIIDSIRQLAPEALVKFQYALDCKDYLAAKDCLLELHTKHDVKDIQHLMKRLFVAYKKTPPPAGWKSSFEQLFTGTWIPMEEAPEDKDVHFYLSQSRAKGKLIKGESIVHNSICMDISSLGLYNLECAFSLSQSVEVYEAIATKFKERKQKGALFLLYIHAFFTLRKQNQIEPANEFLDKAEQINPESLIFLCAKIEQLPFWAKSEKGALFSRITRLLESKVELSRYLESQYEFSVVSSLEGPIKEECQAILEQTESRENRRSLLVAIDALIENCWLGPVPGLLAELGPNHKRTFMLCQKENKPLGAVKALKQLLVKYERSESKKGAVVRLLKKSGTRRSADRSADTLVTLFQEGRKGEAIKRLQALKEIDPTYDNQTPDDQLTLRLLEKQLASLTFTHKE